MTRKCGLCDLPLEVEVDGKRFVFVEHDRGTPTPVSPMCRDGILSRIKRLEDALKTQREHLDRWAANYRDRVDEVLRSHGLPALGESDSEYIAEVNARSDLDRLLRGEQ